MFSMLFLRCPAGWDAADGRLSRCADSLRWRVKLLAFLAEVQRSSRVHRLAPAQIEGRWAWMGMESMNSLPTFGLARSQCAVRLHFGSVDRSVRAAVLSGKVCAQRRRPSRMPQVSVFIWTLEFLLRMPIRWLASSRRENGVGVGLQRVSVWLPLRKV